MDIFCYFNFCHNRINHFRCITLGWAEIRNSLSFPYSYDAYWKYEDPVWKIYIRLHINLCASGMKWMFTKTGFWSAVPQTDKAWTYLQLPLWQWGADNVYLLVLYSWKVNIAENPIALSCRWKSVSFLTSTEYLYSITVY